MDELSRPTTPAAVRAFIVTPPGWLTVQEPTSHERIPLLDPGEEAAINLAHDVHADAILIDDKDGRRAAVQHGLVVVGTLGILELAARRGLVSLPEAAKRLAATDFRLAPRLIQEALRRDKTRWGPQ